jgi:two-component system, OmpR family, phosphate regulon response regulator PhoB
MERSRILVVEDQEDINELMCVHLRREGLEVVSATTGEEALQLVEEQTFHLVILDWMLPGLSGLELCKRLRAHFAVMMVTARAETSDIVLGLEMGADDFMTKPFEIPIFIARVRAILRRVVSPFETRDPDYLQAKSLRINLKSHQAYNGGDPIHLTPSEFKLLTALLRQSGKVLSRSELINCVQGQGVVVVDRAIDTHVFGLRRKLGRSSGLIETIRGVGYRIEKD